MKKILAVLVLVLFVGTFSYAQWVGGPGNIYMMGGNCGVGTTNPTQAFSAYGATKANLILESGYTAVPAVAQTLGSVNMKAADGEQFLMAFRKANGGYHDILQSCYINSLGVFAEYQYFRFDNQKWEMRQGVADAEFKNNGKVFFNNNVAGGVFGPTAGAVGIGVTSMPAGSKLAVAGKVVCKEVEVTLAAFPDYVFSSDYKLRSLYDVENFINANKHLPEVPSAAEVTSNGLNLGDMNATLLQKVEELTLYMIQLQKENDALKARVSNLEK
ncbi:MAG: hypothetical protein ACOYNC_04155 [Bacteroidales bacterium]